MREGPVVSERGEVLWIVERLVAVLAEELALVLVDLPHGEAAVAVAALDAALVIRGPVQQDDLRGQQGDRERVLEIIVQSSNQELHHHHALTLSAGYAGFSHAGHLGAAVGVQPMVETVVCSSSSSSGAGSRTTDWR